MLLREVRGDTIQHTEICTGITKPMFGVIKRREGQDVSFPEGKGERRKAKAGRLPTLGANKHALASGIDKAILLISATLTFALCHALFSVVLSDLYHYAVYFLFLTYG